MKLATADQRERWIVFLRTMKLPLEVSAKAWRKERTHPQNAYLFGVCYPAIGDVMGYTVDDLHEWVCGTFFGWVDRKCPKTPRNPEGIESVPFRTTTRDENGKRDVMDAEAFGRLLETVVFPAAAKCGAYIPEPYQGDERRAA
jgi:hypothetical protein